MRRAIPICIVGLLALAAGCGGDEESSSEAWANDFCSAAADWRSSIDDVVGQFQSPFDLSLDSVRGAVDDGLEATDTFLEEVDSLGAPETEASQEAAGIVDSMTSSIQTTADDLRSAVDSSDSLQDLISQAPQLAAQVGQLEQELRSSLGELEDLDTGELGTELESNEDCAAAQSGS